MKTVKDVIEGARSALGVKTDAEFAKALGVSRGTIANWKSGYSYPDTVQCAALAGLTGLPLGKVLGIVGEARAISKEEKAVWRKLAATAAVIGIALLAVQSFGGDHSTAAAFLVGLAIPESAMAYTLCEIIFGGPRQARASTLQA